MSFQSTLGSLSADGVSEDGTSVPVMAATPPAIACVHPDAIGRDGIARSDSPDAEGIMRKRDAGLGIIDDGTSYSLTTGAPPAVGPREPDPDYPEGASSPFDPKPDGPRYAAMGDAVTVPVLHWIGARIVDAAQAHGGLYAVGGIE